ncbi:maleylacetoacetate isomerase-like protein [Gigaspora margarita]|uniref:Maleylacetoacetate isomerase-like protein n=1 Tax=Gigaspora margarita TaxID=4874 RepID=A0A8H4AP69_GIGMA|nr:maleylacetoacetate isomerase-like protein [Gigaspora margarita]
MNKNRLLIIWKRIDYEYCPVDLLEGAQINPYKVIPTLKIDENVLSQSIAILEYLEETRPEKSLLPNDSYKRALVYYLVGQSLAQAIAGDIQPLHYIRTLQYIESTGGNKNKFGIDMTKFPLIQRIANDLSELDAFKKAHPQNQIDCPAEERN